MFAVLKKIVLDNGKPAQIVFESNDIELMAMPIARVRMLQEKPVVLYFHAQLEPGIDEQERIPGTDPLVTLLDTPMERACYMLLHQEGANIHWAYEGAMTGEEVWDALCSTIDTGKSGQLMDGLKWAAEIHNVIPRLVLGGDAPEFCEGAELAMMCRRLLDIPRFDDDPEPDNTEAPSDNDIEDSDNGEVEDYPEDEVEVKPEPEEQLRGRCLRCGNGPDVPVFNADGFDYPICEYCLNYINNKIAFQDKEGRVHFVAHVWGTHYDYQVLIDEPRIVSEINFTGSFTQTMKALEDYAKKAGWVCVENPNLIMDSEPDEDDDEDIIEPEAITEVTPASTMTDTQLVKDIKCTLDGIPATYPKSEILFKTWLLQHGKELLTGTVSEESFNELMSRLYPHPEPEQKVSAVEEAIAKEAESVKLPKLSAILRPGDTIIRREDKRKTDSEATPIKITGRSPLDDGWMHGEDSCITDGAVDEGYRLVLNRASINSQDLLIEKSTGTIYRAATPGSHGVLLMDDLVHQVGDGITLSWDEADAQFVVYDRKDDPFAE